MSERAHYDLLWADYLMTDPGAGQSIVPDRQFGLVPLVTAGAEARTLRQPTKAGVYITLMLVTDGGDCTVTITGGYNQDDDTTYVFEDVGQSLPLVSIKEGASFYWRIAGLADPLPVREVTASTSFTIDIGGTDQVKITDGTFEPITTNDVDLGSASKTFKSIYCEGTIDFNDAVINSTNAITVQIGGVDILQVDDAAISSFAAAGDTAGQDYYAETEDGGTDGGAASSGQDGGAWSEKCGDGSAAVTTNAGGGDGGAITRAAGAGGAADGSGTGGAGGAAVLTAGNGGAGVTGTGGAGGAVTITSGTGASTSGAGGTGGDGGDLTIAAGGGGDDSEGGSGIGGNGGDLILQAGGAGAGNTTGVNGAVRLNSTVFRFDSQTIDMNDAQVALVLHDAAAGEVELTANVLRVDANSGGTEDLLLPSESEAEGMLLFINNFGGESIVVKDDSDTDTIDTVATGELGIFFCDGTEWVGMNEA